MQLLEEDKPAFKQWLLPKLADRCVITGAPALPNDKLTQTDPRPSQKCSLTMSPSCLAEPVR